jgi:hypothetical protein
MPISVKSEIGAGISKDEATFAPEVHMTAFFYFFRRNSAMQSKIVIRRRLRLDWPAAREVRGNAIPQHIVSVFLLSPAVCGGL